MQCLQSRIIEKKFILLAVTLVASPARASLVRFTTVTEAPKSARIMPQKGEGARPAISTTLTPRRGGMAGSVAVLRNLSK